MYRLRVVRMCITGKGTTHRVSTLSDPSDWEPYGKFGNMFLVRDVKGSRHRRLIYVLEEPIPLDLCLPS